MIKSLIAHLFTASEISSWYFLLKILNLKNLISKYHTWTVSRNIYLWIEGIKTRPWGNTKLMVIKSKLREGSVCVILSLQPGEIIYTYKNIDTHSYIFAFIVLTQVIRSAAYPQLTQRIRNIFLDQTQKSPGNSVVGT